MRPANTPTREAMVMVSHDGADYVPSIDVDPITLPVDSAGMADVFDSGLVRLMDAMCAWESFDTRSTYQLVWSDDRTLVRGVCPVCDDFFPVSEGFPGDELNEGYNAVCCGCDPKESFNG
jgi:hypothetical protein